MYYLLTMDHFDLTKTTYQAFHCQLLTKNTAVQA